MELTGWWGAAVLAAPFVLLSGIMAWAALAGARPRPRVVPSAIATGRYGTPVPDRRATERGRSSERHSTERTGSPATRATTAAKAMPLDDLLAAIASAEQSGDEKRLAGLYVALARHHMSTGRTDEAAGVLRQSIRIASRLGLGAEHAAARLELGDIARASGDLTTACEHWQIARGLYFELENADALEAAEARMQRTGCPTDWVLNDF